MGLPGTALVVPGLRYDRFQNEADDDGGDLDEAALSPKLGLSYLPVEWLTLFANYARAFRAPTYNELYQEGVHFNIGPIINRFVPNADLDPQTTDTIEVGAGLRFDGVIAEADAAFFKGSYFFTWGDDFIDLVVEQPEVVDACFIPPEAGGIDCDGISTARNVNDAELSGVEIEGGYESGRLGLSLGFTHLDGENADTGDPLGSLQPDRLTAVVALKVPEIDSILTYRGIAAARLYQADDDQERDAYTVHDLLYSYAPEEGFLRGLRLDLGVTNIFDEAYERTAPDVYEEGRSFVAAVGYGVSF